MTQEELFNLIKGTYISDSRENIFGSMQFTSVKRQTLNYNELYRYVQDGTVTEDWLNRCIVKNGHVKLLSSALIIHPNKDLFAEAWFKKNKLRDEYKLEYLTKLGVSEDILQKLREYVLSKQEFGPIEILNTPKISAEFYQRQQQGLKLLSIKPQYIDCMPKITDYETGELITFDLATEFANLGLTLSDFTNHVNKIKDKQVFNQFIYATGTTNPTVYNIYKNKFGKLSDVMGLFVNSILSSDYPQDYFNQVMSGTFYIVDKIELASKLSDLGFCIEEMDALVCKLADEYFDMLNSAKINSFNKSMFWPKYSSAKSNVFEDKFSEQCAKLCFDGRVQEFCKMMFLSNDDKLESEMLKLEYEQIIYKLTCDNRNKCSKLFQEIEKSYLNTLAYAETPVPLSAIMDRYTCKLKDHKYPYFIVLRQARKQPEFNIALIEDEELYNLGFRHPIFQNNTNRASTVFEYDDGIVEEVCGPAMTLEEFNNFADEYNNIINSINDQSYYMEDPKEQICSVCYDVPSINEFNESLYYNSEMLQGREDYFNKLRRSNDKKIKTSFKDNAKLEEDYYNSQEQIAEAYENFRFSDYEYSDGCEISKKELDELDVAICENQEIVDLLEQEGDLQNYDYCEETNEYNDDYGYVTEAELADLQKQIDCQKYEYELLQKEIAEQESVDYLPSNDDILYANFNECDFIKDANAASGEDLLELEESIKNNKECYQIVTEQEEEFKNLSPEQLEQLYGRELQ